MQSFTEKLINKKCNFTKSEGTLEVNISNLPIDTILQLIDGLDNYGIVDGILIVSFKHNNSDESYKTWAEYCKNEKIKTSTNNNNNVAKYYEKNNGPLFVAIKNNYEDYYNLYNFQFEACKNNLVISCNNKKATITIENNIMNIDYGERNIVIGDIESIFVNNTKVSCELLYDIIKIGFRHNVVVEPYSNLRRIIVNTTGLVKNISCHNVKCGELDVWKKHGEYCDKKQLFYYFGL